MTRKSHTRRALTPLCTEIKVGHACTSDSHGYGPHVAVCFHWLGIYHTANHLVYDIQCMEWVEISPTLLSAKSTFSFFC